MATSYRVVPNGGGWKVMASASGPRSDHSTVSKHRKKSAAKREARRLADAGDRLVVLKSNGAIQTSNEVRA